MFYILLWERDRVYIQNLDFSKEDKSNEIIKKNQLGMYCTQKKACI